QDPWATMMFVMRTAASADAMKRSIEAAIARVDKEQPVGAMLSMNDFLARSVARRRLSVTLLTVFGAVAALLAAVGLYAVLAFVVGERRREIGVRMALGAQPRAIVADLLGHGLRLTAVGVVAGITLAIA